MFIRDLLQPTHLLIILAIVLLIIGPGKLVGLGGAVGSSIRDFRRSMKDEDEDGDGNGTKTSNGNVKSIADDGFDDELPTRTAIPATVSATAPMTTKSVIDDDDAEGEVVGVGAARSVRTETVERMEEVPLKGEPIKVGTTRRGYGRR